jgi:hypothetical protein
VVFSEQLVPVPPAFIAATSAVRLESVAESTPRITLWPSVHARAAWFVCVRLMSAAPLPGINTTTRAAATSTTPTKRRFILSPSVE